MFQVSGDFRFAMESVPGFGGFEGVGDFTSGGSGGELEMLTENGKEVIIDVSVSFSGGGDEGAGFLFACFTLGAALIEAFLQ